jgi:glutaminyl-tRNA synthetase
MKDSNGHITEVHATVFTDTKSGGAGADSVKAKGVITWVGVADAVRAQVRLYDRLFKEEQPDAGGRDFLTAINPDSLKTTNFNLNAWVILSLTVRTIEHRIWCLTAQSASRTTGPNKASLRRQR